MRYASNFGMPEGVTHLEEFYGERNYYKRVERPHLNQVSEEWQTVTDWFTWDFIKRVWVEVGAGFSPRRVFAL